MWKQRFGLKTTRIEIAIRRVENQFQLVLAVDYLRLLRFFCPRLLLFGIDRFIIRRINLKELAKVFHFVYLTVYLLNYFSRSISKQRITIKISIKKKFIFFSIKLRTKG